MRFKIRGPLLESNAPLWEAGFDTGVEIVKWFDPYTEEGTRDRRDYNGHFADEQAVRHLLMGHTTLNSESPNERRKRQLFLPGTMIALCHIERVRVRLEDSTYYVWGKKGDKQQVCHALLLLQANPEDWKKGRSPRQTLVFPDCVCIGGEIDLSLLEPQHDDFGKAIGSLTEQKITGAKDIKLNASGIAFEGSALFDWQKDELRTAGAFWMTPFLDKQQPKVHNRLYLSLDHELMKAERLKWKASLERIKDMFGELASMFRQKENREKEGELYWTSLELVSRSSIPKFYWTISFSPVQKTTLRFPAGEWQVLVADQMPAQSDVSPRAMLTISPELEIINEGNAIHAQFKHLPASREGVGASFSVQAHRGEDLKWTEVVEVSNVLLGYDAVGTAQAIRQQYKLTTPDSNEAAVEPALLWGFMPLADGWAQLPFLNVNDQEYYDAALEGTANGDLNAQAQTLLVGAAVFGNDALETYNPSEGEHAWNVTLINGEGYRGKWTINDRRELVERELVIYEPEVVLNGFLRLGIQQPSIQDMLPSTDNFLADLMNISLRSYHPQAPFPCPFQLNFSKLSFINSCRTDKSLNFSAPVLGEWAFSYQINDYEEVLHKLLIQGLWKKLGAAEQAAKVEMLWKHKPLIWRRHPQTPLVHTLPITQLQSPPNYPSASRQLVPFECFFEKVNEHEQIARFVVETAVGAKDWPRWVKPEAGIHNSEWGGYGSLTFASLGLPGLIFDPNADESLLEDPDGFLPAQLLYSLPYTDEINTLAQLPKEENDSASVLQNAPDDKPQMIPRREDYWKHWQQLSEKASLAKADVDEMLSRRDGQTVIRHLVEPFEWKIKAEIDFSKYPGSLLIGNADGSAVLSLERDAALRGLHGRFSIKAGALVRSDSGEGFQLTAGSMAAYGDGARLRDQQGFWRGTTLALPDPKNPKVLITPMEYAGDDKQLLFNLSTLFTPLLLKCGNTDTWRFWFRDLPVFTAEKAFMREKTRRYTQDLSLAEDVNDPAAVSAKLNVLTGYEWRLGAGDDQKGSLKLFGFLFFPLSLEKVPMAEEEVKAIELIGRLQLPLGSTHQDDPELGNSVRLVFEQDHLGMQLKQITTQLTDGSPLANTNGIWALEEGGGAFAPRLHWQSLTYGSASGKVALSGVSLEFYLFGARWFVPLQDTAFLPGSAVVLESQERSRNHAIQIQKVEVKLSDHLVAEEINITVSFHWGGANTSLSAGAALMFNLLGDKGSGGENNLMSIVQQLEFFWILKDRRIYLEVDKEKSSLDHRALQISFSGFKDLDPTAFALLPGFAFSTDHPCTGYAAASYKILPEDNKDSKFKMEFACVEVVFECDWGKELPLGKVEALAPVFGSSSGTVCAGYTLTKTNQGWQNSLLLNGVLEVKNLISYPLPAPGMETSQVVILFDASSSKLSPVAEQQLDKLVSAWHKNKDLSFSLEGHTDSDGLVKNNERLSKERVLSVYRYLHNKGISVDRLSEMWFGEARPVKSNRTDEGKDANRRVEIYPVFSFLPAVRPKKGKVALSHIRHTLRILLNQHEVPAPILERGEASVFFNFGKEGAWQFLATVEHRLADVSFTDLKAPIEVSRDRRWTAVQEVRLVAPERLSSFLSGFYHEKEKDHDRIFTTFPAYRDKDEGVDSLKLKEKELTKVSAALFYKPFLKHLLFETGGENELTKLKAALLVEASTIQKILNKPVASKNFVNLQYLPNGVQRAILSVPDDFAMPVFDDEKEQADWSLLSLPFLGRLQSLANDWTEEDKMPAPASQLGADPILALFKKKNDAAPLPVLSLALSSRTDKKDILVQISLFDLSRFRRFKRLDPATLMESWFRLQHPPIERTDAADHKLLSVTAALPADSPARYSRAAMLMRLFDERGESFPPAKGELVNEDPLPVSGLSWRRNALLSWQGFSDIITNDNSSLGPDRETPHSFYFAAAQLHSWTPLLKLGESINRLPAITLLPANLQVEGKLNLRPVSFAVSPYLGIDMMVTKKGADKEKLQLIFAELLCLDQSGSRLLPVASKVWQSEELSGGDGQVPEAWAQEIRDRMAGDAAIAVLRVRKVAGSNASLPKISYDFKVLAGKVGKSIAVDGPSPLRFPLEQLRYREGQYGENPPPATFQLFEAAPPQVRGVQPLYIDQEAWNNTQDSFFQRSRWAWGLSALRFSISYTKDKIGVTGAGEAEKSRLWWSGINYSVRFALPPTITKLLPAKFRARAIHSLLPFPAAIRLPGKLGNMMNDSQEQEHWQAVLPGSLNYLILGARAGVPFIVRHVLLSQDIHQASDEHSAQATLIAGGIPVQQRYPRPQVLPKNPETQAEAAPATALQTWGSYFKKNLTCAWASAPFDNAFVMGSKGPVELVVNLLKPVGGIMEDTFDGVFRFSRIETPAPVGESKWILMAELSAEGKSIKLKQTQDLHFVPIERDKPSETPEHWSGMMRQFLNGLPQGTLLDLKVFAIPDQSFINDQEESVHSIEGYGQALSFPLRLSYHNRIAEPFQYQFVQFEDPAYNRQLVSQAAQVNGDIQYVSKGIKQELVRTELTFAADRLEYNPTSEGLLALFNAEGKKMQGTVTFKLIDASGLERVLAKNEMKAVLNFSLLEMQTAKSIRLAVGDSILIMYEPRQVMYEREDGKEDWIEVEPLLMELRVRIVSAPVTPVPTSAYALLRRKPGEGGVVCSRFAWAPQPARIELLNPWDLKSGKVRRRAIYQWKDTVRMGTESEYGIQKITSSGSTHLDLFPS